MVILKTVDFFYLNSNYIESENNNGGISEVDYSIIKDCNFDNKKLYENIFSKMHFISYTDTLYLFKDKRYFDSFNFNLKKNDLLDIINDKQIISDKRDIRLYIISILEYIFKTKKNKEDFINDIIIPIKNYFDSLEMNVIKKHFCKKDLLFYLITLNILDVSFIKKYINKKEYKKYINKIINILNNLDLSRDISNFLYLIMFTNYLKDNNYFSSVFLKKLININNKLFNELINKEHTFEILNIIITYDIDISYININIIDKWLCNFNNLNYEDFIDSFRFGIEIKFIPKYKENLTKFINDFESNFPYNLKDFHDEYYNLLLKLSRKLINDNLTKNSRNGHLFKHYSNILYYDDYNTDILNYEKVFKNNIFIEVDKINFKIENLFVGINKNIYNEGKNNLNNVVAYKYYNNNEIVNTEITLFDLIKISNYFNMGKDLLSIKDELFNNNLNLIEGFYKIKYKKCLKYFIDEDYSGCLDSILKLFEHIIRVFLNAIGKESEFTEFNVNKNEFSKKLLAKLLDSKYFTEVFNNNDIIISIIRDILVNNKSLGLRNFIYHSFDKGDDSLSNKEYCILIIALLNFLDDVLYNKIKFIIGDKITKFDDYITNNCNSNSNDGSIKDRFNIGVNSRPEKLFTSYLRDFYSSVILLGSYFDSESINRVENIVKNNKHIFNISICDNYERMLVNEIKDILGIDLLIW